MSPNNPLHQLLRSLLVAYAGGASGAAIPCDIPVPLDERRALTYKTCR